LEFIPGQKANVPQPCSTYALQAVFKWPSASLGVCFTQET